MKRGNRFLCKIVPLFFIFFGLFFSGPLFAYEIFIFRPHMDKTPLIPGNKLTVHGEFFGQLLSPSTFPSYNDMSGQEDRWNYGFQNIIFLTKTTSFLAQLVVHDDGDRRTKFDWHFSLRQLFFENLVLIIGHDSNHDSDYRSLSIMSNSYVNRNYAGFGFPLKRDPFYIEPFTLFFSSSTKQKTHLDQSGDDIRQEFGIRIGAWIQNLVGINFQIFSQTQELFTLGEAFIADLILRIKLLNHLELSLGASLWKDIKESPYGNQNKFYKFMWGIAIPF